MATVFGKSSEAYLKSKVEPTVNTIKAQTSEIKTKTDKLPVDTAAILGTPFVDISSDIGAVAGGVGGIDAKLGAPVNANISADIANVKSDTGDIKTKTDKLPADTAALLGTPVGADLATDIAGAKASADGVKSVTDNLPDGGALTSLAQGSDLTAAQADITAIKAITDNCPPNTGAAFVSVENAVSNAHSTTDGKVDSVKAVVDSTESKIGTPSVDLITDIGGGFTAVMNSVGGTLESDVAAVQSDVTTIDGTVNTIKSNQDVPSQNSANNSHISDVVGNKTDTPEGGDSLVSIGKTTAARVSMSVADDKISYPNGTTEETVYEITPSGAKYRLKAPRVDCINCTQSGTLRVYEKINGVYRSVLSQSTSAGEVYILAVDFVTDNDVKITYQADVGEGVSRDIPYVVGTIGN